MTTGGASLFRPIGLVGVESMQSDHDLDGGRSAEFSERDGVLVVHDLELFRPGFEAFCRRLANAAARLGGVRSATICLTSGTCRLEFDGGRFTAAEMAEWFAEAVRNAVEAGPGAEAGRGGWTSLVTFSTEQGGATWETTRQGRGLMTLYQQSLAGDRGLARRDANELAGATGVKSCRVGLLSRDLELRFESDQVHPSAAYSLANAAYLRAIQPAPAPIESHEEAIPPVASGLQRLGYLALAGGAFGLSIVGLVIPGVPTVPFLLATSYYLVRSSPALNERLLRSKFFGPILTDLELGHGLQKTNKLKLVGLTLTIGLVTILLITPAWPILLVMALVSSASLIAIARIPAIPSEPDQPPRLRLLTA
jgi:uncharacterized membrane protein YbaN (DUF454 family)